MKYIPARHIKRMFPFEFYYELSEKWKQWLPASAAFSANVLMEAEGKTPITKEEQKLVFEDELKTKFSSFEALYKNNLIDAQPYPLLMLEPYVNKEEIILKKKIPELDFLVVQYFDSKQQPVFSKDVKIESIRQIPEILFDDPNLLIGLMMTHQSSTSEDSDLHSEENVMTTAIIKAPKFIEEQWTEKIEKESNKKAKQGGDE